MRPFVPETREISTKRLWAIRIVVLVVFGPQVLAGMVVNPYQSLGAFLAMLLVYYLVVRWLSTDQTQPEKQTPASG